MQTYTIEKKQSGPYNMILGHFDARSKSHAFKQMKKDLEDKGETVPKRKEVNIYTYF